MYAVRTMLLMLVTMVNMAAAGAAFAAEDATLRLDWLPTGYHAPYFYALARGYYRDQGINLQILDGKGSASTLTAVSDGGETFGLASLTTMSLAVARGAPLVAVADMIQKMPDGVIALQGSGIRKPGDLEGKRWGFIAEDAGARLFPAFAAKNGINVDKIQKVTVGYAISYSALLQGQVDFLIGWSFTDALKIAKQKPIGPPILYSDNGVNMLGNGIIVNRKTVEQKPALVKSFLAATARGFDDALKDPAAAVDALMAARPNSDRELMAEEFKRTPPFLHTARSEGRGFGWMAKEDWDQTIDLLQKYFALSPDIKVDTLYSNAYLPGQ